MGVSPFSIDTAHIKRVNLSKAISTFVAKIISLCIGGGSVESLLFDYVKTTVYLKVCK